MTTIDFHPNNRSNALAYLTELIERDGSQGHNLLLEPELKGFLSLLGISVPQGAVGRTRFEAISIASRIGGRAVLKIVSRNTPHKSAVGGVTIISAPDEAEAAYEELTKRGGAANREIEIEGVLVEEFVGEGIECVLSYTAETSFGPTLMFGVGGTGLDKATDVGFRLAPITRQEAREWVEDVASRTDSLTFGPEYAGGISALVDAIVTIGDLADDPNEIGRLLELEMNPLLVQPQRVIALDAIATFERADVRGATL